MGNNITVYDSIIISDGIANEVSRYIIYDETNDMLALCYIGTHMFTINGYGFNTITKLSLLEIISPNDDKYILYQKAIDEFNANNTKTPIVGDNKSLSINFYNTSLVKFLSEKRLNKIKKLL